MTGVTCDEVRDLLTPFLDDELAIAERTWVTDHLTECAACAGAVEAQMALRARLRAAGTFAMPDALDGKVRDRLGIFDRAAHQRRRRVLLVGSHLAAAAVGALLLYGAMAHLTTGDRVVRDALAAHTRALISGHSVIVASSDQHTVKPWFATHVPFSPPVIDPEPADFPLLGGRVEMLAELPAAVAVYGRRRHKIDVFIQPADASSIVAERAAMRNGYNVLTWRRGAFVFLAMSDLNASELEHLKQRLVSAPQDARP